MHNQSIPVCTDMHGGFGVGCTGRLRHRPFPVAYPFGGVHGSSGFLFSYYPRLHPFVLASVVSRGLRFFLFAWLIWRYGAPIKVFIDKYFNILAIAFTVLLIGSFVAVKYLIQ